MGWCPGFHSLFTHSAQGIPMASRDLGWVQAHQTLNLNPQVVWSVVWPDSPAQLEPFCWLSWLGFQIMWKGMNLMAGATRCQELSSWWSHNVQWKRLIRQLLWFHIIPFSFSKVKASVKHEEGRNEWEGSSKSEERRKNRALKFLFCFPLSCTPNPRVLTCSILLVCQKIFSPNVFISTQLPHLSYTSLFCSPGSSHGIC